MPGTVSVGCKLPHGIIMQLFRMDTHDEPQFGGGTKQVQRAVRLDDRRIKLNGFARWKGRDMPHDIRMGAGITHGVDADFFAEWLKQNKDLEAVKKGLIFAQAKGGEMESQLKDHVSLKSGMEPGDPGNLPKEFSGVSTYTAKD